MVGGVPISVRGLQDGPRASPILSVAPVLLFLPLEIRLTQMNRRLGGSSDSEIHHLDEDREAHREVDVPLRNVQPQAVANERDSDQQQEGKRQDFLRRMPVDEIADRTG